ncbi:MAG: YebC/PmpR family DNA-binding transcriptional regulator [Actinomycetes bacterium]
MSGHSKWATIKHKKGAADKARGKLFAKIARQIEVAAREGGGDINSNATLRTVIQKAKAGQMTNDAIDRAVKRGSGEVQGENYESITYEGYAPGGVAMLVDTLTNNRNRTGADVRNIFSKLGGAMAEPGAVGWQFSRRGVIYVGGTTSEDDIMLLALDAGAEDISRDGSSWKILSEPNAVYDVKTALETAGIEVLSAESTMVSSTIIDVTDAETAAKIMKVMDALEDNDDVQDVYANFDISDEIMEALE